jgi:RNA recognition motif-containing protein
MAALAQATPSAGNVAASTGAGGGPTPDEASPAGPPVITPGGGKTGLTKTAQKILRSQKHPAGPTLFVGNLSFNSTQEGLLELFERSAKAREGWTKSMKERKREEKREKRKADSLEAKKRRAERDAAKAGKAGAESGSDSDSDSDDDEEDKGKADAASSDDDDDSSSSSSSSSDEEQDDGEEATPRGAGVRKVRMGTFEDTGKCKG